MALGRWGRRADGTTTGPTNLSSGFGPAFWTVLLLDFASWIILLAGVASLQQYCAADYSSETAIGTRARNNQCSQDLRLQWWNMVLQLIVLLAIAHTAMWRGLAASRVALSTLLGIVTVMLMLDTHTYLGARRGTVGVTHTRQTVYFIGALLCALFNFLMILVLGNHHGAAAVADAAPLGHKGPHSTTTTTTAGPAVV